jgi:hypothetical protein
VFRRLGELSVPSFAFVNGAALGGITPYLDRTGITEKVTGTRFRI